MKYSCRRLVATILLSAGLLRATGAQAWEVDTHALITYVAFDRSGFVTDGPELERRLGLERFPPSEPFRVPEILATAFAATGYFDTAGGIDQSEVLPSTELRPLRYYDRAQMPREYRALADPLGSREREPRAWLMRGAIREDDLIQEDFDREPVPPDADPHGEHRRVFQHFFDPIKLRGLEFDVGSETLTCVGLDQVAHALPGPCMPSIDWALGRQNAYTNPATPPDPQRRNHFTWADARDAEWCALTYSNGASEQEDAAVRRLCWATTFKSLGHVLHLWQVTSQRRVSRI